MVKSIDLPTTTLHKRFPIPASLHWHIVAAIHPQHDYPKKCAQFLDCIIELPMVNSQPCVPNRGACFRRRETNVNCFLRTSAREKL